MAITLRTVTGSALSYLQVDTNFSSFYYSSSISGSSITFFKTGSVAIGEPPSSSSITLPLPSKWTDITGGIQRSSLVKIVGPLAQGNTNVSATGENSHAQGALTQAIGTGSHAEGYSSTANGIYSHAEGESTQATNIGAHAEGFLTEASGQYSHAEGRDTLAFMTGSHAEGLSTQARGLYSHAEGNGTIASGSYSHSEGESTQAFGIGSHAEGLNTFASGAYQHVQGQFNLTSPMQGAFIIGNGISAGSRSNLIHAAGTTVQVTGSLNVTSGITGSLFGTASRATSASWAPNASPIEVYNNVIDFGTLYSTAPGAAGGTTNITQSIVFGWSAGESSNNINAVNFLGNRAGRYSQNVEYSNFFGCEAGRATSASRSNFLGGFTGRLATNANDSNFLGYSAGDQASAAPNSNFLGYQAGLQAISASNSNFFGRSAGQYAASASFSTLIGHQVGFETTATASNSIGSNNIIIGTNITLAAQQTNAINLGGIIFATGSYATTTGNPFSGSMPSSRVGIATTTPQHTLDVNGNGNFTSNLTVTGSSTFIGPVNMGNSAGTGNLTVTSNQPYLFLTRGNGDTSILLNTGDTTVSASLDVLNNQFFEINTNARLKLSTGRKERITIDSTGGIIINSGSQATAPTVLQVTGSVSISDILTLTRRTTTPTPQEGMIISSGSAGASILYYYNGTIWNPLF